MAFKTLQGAGFKQPFKNLLSLFYFPNPIMQGEEH